MAKLFNKGAALTPRQNYERQFTAARHYMLILVIVTAVNLLLVCFGSTYYFLFSAYVPYVIALIGMSWCGMLPSEFYDSPKEEYIFYDKSLFVAFLILAVMITSLYLLAWFMSKKNRVGWIIFALVFFITDTVLMLVFEGLAFLSVVNVMYHVMFIYALVMGIIAHRKLLYMPEYEPVTEEEAPAAETAEGEQAPAAEAKPDSPVLRKADKDVKHKVLLEKRMFNMDICYRRVKRVNELVINGNVYDEYVALAEQPHMLEAYVDGRHIVAGYTGTHSVINVDGQQVAKKLRII